MAKREYTKEEKDRILDKFRKRVLLAAFVLPIVFDIIFVELIFYFFN